MPMNLFREICEVLDEAAVEYTTGAIAGSDIIFIGDAAVIPEEICAHSIEEAISEASRHKDSISEVLKLKDTYPLTIAEDRWRTQKGMMTARLLAHAQIFSQLYARNCEVRKIDSRTAAEFLEENHSYGEAKCRYRYGLYLKRHTGHNAAKDTANSRKIQPGTLVAVATFSNARKWIKGDKTIRSYEWTRYASLPGVRLSGGMGKLLKAFIEEVKPDDIMTYADLEWSEGDVYKALGFVLEGQKAPVDFIIGSDWIRMALPGSRAAHDCSSEAIAPDALYFRNMGSNKYRLKLTDYQ